MRKCRNIFRLFHAKDSKRKVFLQVVTIVGLFAFPFLYLQEKYTKEVLIDLALGSRSVEELVKPDNDTLVLYGASDKLKGKSPFIVIAVTSLPENAFRRNIIRNTWANKAYEKYGVSVYFFLGKPHTQDGMENLVREAKQFEDLIVDDFHESYYALAIKTLRILKYFKFYHSKSKYLVKTDDDVFVNVQNLVHYCYTKNREFEGKYQQEHEQNPSHVSPFHYLGGVIHEGRGCHTWNSFSKWYAPANVWGNVLEHVLKFKISAKENAGKSISVLEDDSESEKLLKNELMDKNTYPPYAEGNFYVLSDDAVKDILEASRKVPLYHLEDVYVTGVLATWMLGIKKDNMLFISSASNIFPTLSYRWYTQFVPPQELVAFHCDNNVELLTTIYHESVAS